jgi:hypothetical protein
MIRIAKYQHHISLYSSTEMGRVTNDISAKIFPSLMEDVIRCVSLLISTWPFVRKEDFSFQNNKFCVLRVTVGHEP